MQESACNAGDLSSIPGSERSPGEGSGNPLQYFWLENPMDRGVSCGLVCHSPWGRRSWTQLSNYTTTTCFLFFFLPSIHILLLINHM